jgi:sorting nexin-4
MEPNPETTPMYVCDPVLNKDKTISYTSYTLQGSRVPQPLIRRYRDFNALRSKLIERWPGVYIPNIPHKQLVGAKDKEVVEMRIEQINRFCLKISKIGYLFSSEEMENFLKNEADIPKLLSSMKQQTPEELLRKYSNVFTSYDENFDTQAGKLDQEKFLKTLKDNFTRLKTFRKVVDQSKEKTKNMLEIYKSLFTEFNKFETEFLNGLVNEDENKLVFGNKENVEISQNISDITSKNLNPFDKLSDSVNEDFLDCEAMIEAFESLNSLQNTYDKMTKNFTTMNTQLAELQAGKTNLKSLLSFKSKEETIAQLNTDKEKLEKNIEHIGNVIKIAIFNMQNEIKIFKFNKLENYYKELNDIEKDFENNVNSFDILWDSILNNQKIKNYQ